MRALCTHKKILLPLLVAVFFSVPLAANAGLSEIILSIVGWILGAATSLFNAVINLFVLQMGGLIRGTSSTLAGVAVGPSIDLVWKVVRDLVNLSFIFGLVYVGFLTILDVGTNTKQFVSSIIISALLVNFSLFISKGIIDISNITASEIYQQMGVTNAPTKTIGEAFLTRMGVYNLVGVPNAKGQLSTQVTQVSGADDWLAYVVGGSIFILVAAFVFFAGAILLAIRFAVLVIAMMLSPIAFAATVFPACAAYRKQWWDTILQQAFFAPAYLFMLYIALVVAEGYQQQIKKIDNIYIYNTSSVFNSGFHALAFFLITTAMMVAALVVARQMGAYGASFATRTAGRFTAGAIGFLGRNTVGAVAGRLAQSHHFQRWAGQSRAAEIALRATRGLSHSSFDVRGLRATQRLAGTAGIDTGTAQVGGFEGRVERTAARRRAFGESLRDTRSQADVQAGRGSPREEYAARQARKWFTRSGSRSSGNTLFGVMGRANRIEASRILSAQLATLTTQRDTLEAREASYSQQVSRLGTELAALQAIRAQNRTPAQNMRITILEGPQTDQRSIAAAEQRLTETQQRLQRVQTERQRVVNIFATYGLENPDPNAEIYNVVTGQGRMPHAHEQNY